jgi:hypothetical protein
MLEDPLEGFPLEDDIEGIEGIGLGEDEGSPAKSTGPQHTSSPLPPTATATALPSRDYRVVLLVLEPQVDY